MRKVLIAIPSCPNLKYWHSALKNTWCRDLPSGLDYKFFLGNSHQKSEPDEVKLDVGDSLENLTHKVVRMFEWSLEVGYDYVFKSDLDTLIIVNNLINSGYESYDWSGGQNSFFASGGGGYWLSKKAMEIVANSPVETGPAEDVNTARALLVQGIPLHHDPRYLFIPGQRIDSNTITYHLSSVKGWGCKASPEDMYAAYAGTFKLPQSETAKQRMLRRPPR